MERSHDLSSWLNPHVAQTGDDQTIQPQVAQKGADSFVRVVDEFLRPFGEGPLSETERTRLRDDVARAPLIALIVGDLTFRGRTMTDLCSSMTIIEWVVDAVMRARGRPTPFSTLAAVFGSTWATTYNPRSVAGRIYLQCIWELLGASGGDDAAFRGSYAPPAIWERDDVAAMHQAYLDTLSYYSTRSFDNNWRLVVEVARALHDSWSPRYRPGLLRRMQQVKMFWSTPYLRVVGRNPLLSVDDVLLQIEKEVESEEQKKFGAGSSAAREAVDRAGRASGQLSPECDFWTYEELEHWSRWLLTTLNVPQLCEIVREQKALFEMLGSVELDEPCEQIERGELVAVVRDAIRASPKRGLCLLLGRYTAPPAAARWMSQKWYNLDVLADYLTPEIARRLLIEGVTTEESYLFEVDEDPLHYYLDEEGVEVEQNILYENLLRNQIIADLYTKTITEPPAELQFRLTVEKLNAADPPRLVSSTTYISPFRGKWVALVVVRGLLAISPISTNQRWGFRGDERVLIESDAGNLLPPQRLVLQAGDVLVATFSNDVYAEDVQGIDERSIYDVLVLRAAENETTWFEYTGF